MVSTKQNLTFILRWVQKDEDPFLVNFVIITCKFSHPQNSLICISDVKQKWDYKIFCVFSDLITEK
jgi:hypothetical protein